MCLRILSCCSVNTVRTRWVCMMQGWRGDDMNRASHRLVFFTSSWCRAARRRRCRRDARPAGCWSDASFRCVCCCDRRDWRPDDSRRRGRVGQTIAANPRFVNWPTTFNMSKADAVVALAHPLASLQRPIADDTYEAGGMKGVAVRPHHERVRIERLLTATTSADEKSESRQTTIAQRPAALDLDLFAAASLSFPPARAHACAL